MYGVLLQEIKKRWILEVKPKEGHVLIFVMFVTVKQDLKFILIIVLYIMACHVIKELSMLICLCFNRY